MTQLDSVFFTSDTHFGHKNILKFCRNTRIGDTPDEMDENIIRRWNEQVKPNDYVFHLGDVAFCGIEKAKAILSRLNGNIVLIRGNHDSEGMVRLDRWVDVHDIHRLKIHDQSLMLCHYPIYEWDNIHRGAYHLHGHVHGNKMPIGGRIMDVGIDARPTGDMKLFTWDEIHAAMQEKAIRTHGDSTHPNK